MTKVWPPSDESMPFLVAFLIGVFLLMYSIFFSSRKETKYVKEAKEEKRAKCAEAQALMTKAESEKDSDHKATDKQPERVTDLPESSRVLGLLFDEGQYE